MAPWLLFVMLGAVFYMGRTANGELRQKASLESVHVISDIEYRFATTRVSMKYYNPYNSSVSADFHIMMPRNSFISNFSMEIDGNVTVGEVKEKSVAKNIYEHAVETRQSAGYIEVKHRFTNVFDISVNVEPQKNIVYNLTYQELLTRQDYKYRHVIHLSNGGIIDDFLVEVFITEPHDIIDLSVPEIKGDILMNITDDTELDSASIVYTSSREVHIKYNPSRKQQEEISDKDGVAGLFRVEYNVDRQNNSNLIYAVDGYFVHFFTPDSLPSLPKHVVFMLDVSGSMYCCKIGPLKEAMENILDQLDPELDAFLIGKFSSDVSWMMDKFLLANSTNKELGKNYIKALQADGFTNINSALLQSIEKHKPALTSTKKSIIVFLTDGDPTVGVTDVELIKKNVREANEQISLFAICFGDDCDSKFLREIATENGGFNKKIYVDSDSSLQIENLYKEISNILLKDITFVYLDGAVNTSTSKFSSYFKGSELVVSGVLTQEYLSTIKVNLTMTNFWGRDSEILKLELYGDDFTIYDDGFSQNSRLTSIQSLSEITEKTYAYITLQQLLKEDRTEEVRHDILNLALKYNFVTPLTSMVVANSKVKEHFFEEETKQIPRHHVRFTTTPPMTVPRSTRTSQRTPRKPLPILSHIPAILLKPLNCKAELCFTDSIQCRNQTDIVLLADRAAKIYIYGQVRKVSDTNCLENLDRVFVNIKDRVSEFTPEFFRIRGKIYEGNIWEKVHLKLGTFVRLLISFQKTENFEKVIFLHFKIYKSFIEPKGILSDYVKDLHCTRHSLNQIVLSNKVTAFHKVKYKTTTGRWKRCFKM